MGFKLLSVINNRHFHSLLGNLVSAFLNVLSFAILVRLLSLSAFGEWVLFIGTYTVLDQIRTALLQSGIIKFYTGSDEKTGKEVAGSAWYLVLILTGIYLLLNLIVGVALYGQFDETWRFFIRWLGVMMVVSVPFNVASWFLQAEHRFDKILQVRFWQNGGFLVLILAFHFFSTVTLPHVLFAYMAGLAATSCFTLIKGWTKVRQVVHSTKKQVLVLVKYGWLIVGSMISSGFLNYSDNFLIRTMISPAAVAIYSIPQKFMEVIEIILRSFVATAQPTLSGAANRNDWAGVSRAFSRYTGVVSIVIIPFIIGLIIFTKPLIIILADKAYLPATDVVRIFLLCAILYPIDRFIGVALDMINRPLTNFYKNFLKLVLNVIGDIVFILLFHDVRWVAFGSLLNMIICVIVGYYMLKKYVPFTLNDIVKLGWAECQILLEKVTGKLKLVK
ncbi:lipopolysaccharide biosynthesis protein [Chitinophaga pinensis]|uniref:Polysaccharide biosynthesis protein n=1 Tax=Chitinophaga pinensis (strain ATCC 43595 / DSM 2588 / LMG 13176 / NBRC 15968 / NCIMB 11800 / UQM 2034) TaxID=485918 RepID=A0A979GXH3_CHIPD|nr:oligosaccharide flippase family protein [Chitinophaga pinensis]ACU61175.1 polysaccharide biosynthesis protein [Chitinophaga pinensis DSM 2588]